MEKYEENVKKELENLTNTQRLLFGACCIDRILHFIAGFDYFLEENHIKRITKEPYLSLCTDWLDSIFLYVNIYKKLLLSSSSLDTSDLEQAGMIGLHKAIEKFDSNKPYEFSTYAVWWIKQSILREIMNNANVVRIPVHVHEKIMKIHKLESESIIKYGYVDINSICTQMDIDEERYNSLKMIDFKFNKIKSLDCYISNDEDEDTPMIYFITASNTLNNISLDFSDPNEIIDKKLFKEDILNSLDCLTEKERNVILVRFGFLDGEIHTLEEIGTIYKVTRERIRQIENKALKKLFRSHYMQEIYKQYTIA